MELSHQVIPLPMAQRLKELGVKQESYFSWFKYQYSKRKLKYPGKMGRFTQQEFCGILKSDDPFSADYAVIDKFCAFTVAELGEVLPLRFHTKTRDFDHEDWMGYDSDDEYLVGPFKTEAEARGILLIHLLESNLITVQEVNSRI